MTPRGDPRKMFSLMLTAEERAKLERLAQQERRSAGDWLRVQIHDAYEEQFGDEKPPTVKRGQ